MDEAHCPTCQEYEAAVMAAPPGEPPAQAQPCEAYQMSPVFRDWLVGRMRDELEQTFNPGA